MMIVCPFVLLILGSRRGRDHMIIGYTTTSVSSTNKTDHHNIAEILLKVALNTITLTLHFILVIVLSYVF